jgi:hypothetical protein
LIYALLGERSVITEPDLKAALECWRYAEQSARYIFTDKLGDPIADTILAALRMAPNGLTETDIRDLFHRNAKSNQLDRALQILLAGARNLRPGGNGRPPGNQMARREEIGGAFESNGLRHKRHKRRKPRRWGDFGRLRRFCRTSASSKTTELAPVITHVGAAGR